MGNAITNPVIDVFIGMMAAEFSKQYSFSAEQKTLLNEAMHELLNEAGQGTMDAETLSFRFAERFKPIFALSDPESAAKNADDLQVSIYSEGEKIIAFAKKLKPLKPSTANFFGAAFTN